MTPRLTALALLLLSLALAAPASAAGNQVGLSWDGAVWQPALVGTLFTDANAPHLWVPGDAATARFHVRNQSGDGAALVVEYHLAGASHLVDDSDLQVSARLGAGAWRPLTGGRGWLSLGGSALGGGESAVVTVRAVFHWSSRNASQSRTVPLRFRVVLTQTSAGPGPTTTGSTNPGGTSSLLPNTGSTVSRWAVGAAGLCLGAGLALVVGSRGKERR